MEEVEKKFYLEIKSAVDDYAEKTVAAIEEASVNTSAFTYGEEIEKLRGLTLSEEQKTSLKLILKGVGLGVIHSLFVSIDGGTVLSNEEKALELVNRKTGKPLTEGALHENFFDVVLD